VREADDEENKRKQGRTIAKKIMDGITTDMVSGSISGEIKSEYANVIKGSKRQTSIEEIAMAGGLKGQLADALRDAENAIEIIKKFGNRNDKS